MPQRIKAQNTALEADGARNDTWDTRQITLSAKTAHTLAVIGGSHMTKYTLMSIENDHRITKNTDREFLCAIQMAMLAALVEAGQMSEMQYRYAEKRLHA